MINDKTPPKTGLALGGVLFLICGKIMGCGSQKTLLDRKCTVGGLGTPYSRNNVYIIFWKLSSLRTSRLS
jgi:hypothetical protein